MQIDIYVSQQTDGWTFHLSPSECRKIKTAFPSAMPISTIFLANENKLSLQQIFGNIEKHIKPTLIGIQEDDLKQLTVVFKDADTEQELKKAS